MKLEEIVKACFEEHKSKTEIWQYGEPIKAYWDLDGLKICYQNGECFHYCPINDNKITWW